MRARAALVAVAALALALAPAGCGERRGAATRTVPEPAGPVERADARAVAVADVSLVDYALDVAGSRVARDGLIAFVATNDGLVRHALAVDGPAGQVRTAALRPGQRASFTVRLPPGTYKWYCPLADHERRGMTGRVRVAE
jgi:plastocyanin